MGSYLSSPRPALPPPAHGQGPPDPWPGPAPAPHGVHRRRRVHTRPSPDWKPAKAGGLVTGTQKPPPARPSGPCAWGSPRRRPPGQACGPVTVRIARAAPAQGARGAGRPDPCARDAVLSALSLCSKGRRRFDGPLWFEGPASAGGTPGPRPRASAFRPLISNAAGPAFVPQPGPLGRGRRPRGHHVRMEETGPGPAARPLPPAARPAAGTTPARAAEPQPQSGEQVRGFRGRAPAPGAQSGAPGASLAPEDQDQDAQPAGRLGR